MRSLFTFILLALPATAAAADLSDLAWLEGEWRGYSVMGDESNVNHKAFRLEQAGRYLVERTLSMCPPPEPSTDYETHQDMTVFYAVGGELRAKGFFVEGVVQSSTVTVEGPKVTVESLEVEGGPPGMRARLVYERDGEDRFTGTFDVDWSGEGWQCYQTYAFERLR